MTDKKKIGTAVLTIAEVKRIIAKYPDTHEVWVSVDTQDVSDCEYTGPVHEITEGAFPPRIFLWAKADVGKDEEE